MTGNQDLRPGVISNSERFVLYVPAPDGFGMPYDSFEFKVRPSPPTQSLLALPSAFFQAIDCPYDPDRESLPATISMLVIPVNDSPKINSIALTFNESNGASAITLLPLESLRAIDSDPSDILTAVILSLPTVGHLEDDNGVDGRVEIYSYDKTSSLETRRHLTWQHFCQ